MEKDIEPNFGEQPIARIMARYELKVSDIVEASTEQITHKMVSKACKGRRLTENAYEKILKALNKVTSENYSLKDLFTY